LHFAPLLGKNRAIKLLRNETMTAELRPMTLGELLDRAFSYYRGHVWTFAGILAPAEVVAIGFSLAIQALRAHSPGPLLHGAPTPAENFAIFGPIYAALIVNLFVTSMVHTVALAASSSAVSKFHLGRSTTIKNAYNSLRGSIWRLAGLYGLFVLITIAAFIVLIVAMSFLAGIVAIVARAFDAEGTALSTIIGFAVILATPAGAAIVFTVLLRFVLAVPALILERLGPVRALRRSSFLAAGSLGRIFLACLLGYLIVTVVALTCEAPFLVTGRLVGFKLNHSPLWLAAPTMIAGGIGATFSYPVLMIMLPLFYYEARVRKEGFDLQVMMSAQGSPEPGSGIVADSALPLPRMSVFLVVALTFLTLGLYEPVWYLNRIAAFNRLNSREKLNRGISLLALVLLASSFTASIIQGVTRKDAHQLAGVLALAGGITLLLQSFQARRLIEEHVNARIRSGPVFLQPEILNPIAVFFFHIWYLQYKINDMFELIYAGPPPIMEQGSVTGTAAAPRV
jgi:hypothetical protein